MVRRAKQSWLKQLHTALEKRIQLCCCLGLLRSYPVNHQTQTFHEQLLISHISPPHPTLDVGNVRCQGTQNMEFPLKLGVSVVVGLNCG